MLVAHFPSSFGLTVRQFPFRMFSFSQDLRRCWRYFLFASADLNTSVSSTGCRRL